ncbi:MAG: electron transfer flavoprotein subunit alpha/FixB family protein [Acidobacteria bacterium]|nr:MAG: electron transfer flavoprotein subunit alpha/FixB family protein [Acidobacteriota bacterium]
MPGKTLVLAEHRAGKIKSISWEAIGFGQKLAERLNQELKVVLIGKAIGDLAEEVSRRCGQEVLTLVNDHCETYTPEAYCHILSQVAQQETPFLFLMGHTYQAIDFAPKLATRLGRGFIPNCVDCQIDADRVVFVRQVFNGKINLQVGLKGEPPYFVSLQQGAFNAYEVQSRQSPRVVNLTIPLPDEVLKRKVLEIFQAAQGKVDLSQAEIIIAGGRGLGSKEKFQLILDLAEALGAAVGASRPVTDGGWLPKEHQIGSSGQTVTPKLYIACGISGAIQHLVGMMNSSCIVAINKDPNAPIFSVADYGIVGDVFKVLPVLIELAKEIRK